MLGCKKEYGWVTHLKRTLIRGIDGMNEVNKALEEFHRIHDHLPVMHEDIPEILSELKSKYIVEIVTAYPDEKSRNLLHCRL